MIIHTQLDALKLDATDQQPVNRVVRQARPASAASSSASAACSSASAAIRQPQSWLRYYVPAAGMQHPTYGAERVRAEAQARAKQALVVSSTCNNLPRGHPPASQPTTSSNAQPQAQRSNTNSNTSAASNAAAAGTTVPDFLRRPPKPEEAMVARSASSPTPGEAAVAAVKRTAVAAAAAAAARPPKPRRASAGGGASNVCARSERGDAGSDASGRYKAVSAEVSEIGREIGLDAQQHPEVNDGVIMIS
jgi:hypothetical protein